MGTPAPAEVTVAVASADPVVAAIARLEGKVDVALALHGADLRELRHDRDDHEVRIRAQEARKTVSPRDLWVGLGGAAATGAALASIIRTIYPA
ncbi:tail needle protein [Microbacterium phage Zeta1847]|uniref:Tail needle protein n=1 Tax=Microbacterium phage Zeta1847 TaxID=2201444 RepID=A0A2Z4Q9H1_9CAUD|nr:tail needle protein [Microbacterium phage Zeta1847]AWY06654.1 tail needle protein [Microbacterium phage Zeta1847]